MAFKAQLEALQGVWEESEKSGKQWFVEDTTATLVWKGRLGRKFTLTDSSGELVWGIGGEPKFKLDTAFKKGDKKVTWQGAKEPSKSFQWDYVGDSFDKEAATKAAEEAREARAKAKETKGKAKGKGKAGESGKGKGKDKGAGKGKDSKGKGKGKGEAEEKRIDPADGAAYTRAQMEKFYKGSFSNMDICAYWMDCKVEKGKGAGKAKGKESPTKGKGKGKEPVSKGKGKGKEPVSKGVAKGKAKGGDARGSMPRVDPADGVAYSWEEMRAHYSGTYSKSQITTYWETSCTSPKGKAQGKGAKGKGKETKGKGKGKAKAAPKPAW